MLSVLWFHDIEDYGHAVFVIVSDETLVCIRGVGPDDAITLETAFGLLVVRDDNPLAWLNFKLLCELCRAGILHHGIDIDDCERLDLHQLASDRVNFLSRCHFVPALLEQLFQIL